MPQKVKIKKEIQKIITTIALAAIIAAVGSIYNNNSKAYAQTDNSGGGASTDNSGGGSTDNSGSGGSGSTDNSGGSTTTTTTNQPTTQGSSDQSKQGGGSDQLVNNLFHTGAKLVCYGLTQSPICSALSAHVVTPHHHHKG